MRSSNPRSRSRRHFTRDDRRRLVDAWRRSGLTQTQFANEHGIGPSYLSRWKKEFPESDVTGEAGPAPLPVHVIGVERGDVAAVQEPFEVRLPSGVALSIPPRFDRASLEALLAVLEFARC